MYWDKTWFVFYHFRKKPTLIMAFNTTKSAPMTGSLSASSQDPLWWLDCSSEICAVSVHRIPPLGSGNYSILFPILYSAFAVIEAAHLCKLTVPCCGCFQEIVCIPET